MATALKRNLSRGIGTAATAVGAYAVPAGRVSTVVGLSLANITTGAISVSAAVWDGTNLTHIVKDAPVPAGSTLVAIGSEQKIMLQAADEVRVWSSVAASVDAIMSVAEVF